jgi:hypothetical protein
MCSNIDAVGFSHQNVKKTGVLLSLLPSPRLSLVANIIKIKKMKYY